MSEQSSEAPSFSDIQRVTQEHFGKWPCLWQMKVAKAFIQKDRDIVCIAGMSLGKTMTFWMPLLLKPGIQINSESRMWTHLQRLACEAYPFQQRWQPHDIGDKKYLAVIVSPEQLMKPGGEFEKLLRKPEFVSDIIGFVFDEVHCITSWGDFRPEYKELQCLRYILPCYVPFMMVSATLTPIDLSHGKRLLHMRSENLVTIQMSIDRSNVKLCVRKIKYSLSSYQDLAFLIPDGWSNSDPIPPKFLIFFDNIQDTIAAAKILQKRLLLDMHHKIKWYNSDMTTEYKENEVNHLISGDLYLFTMSDTSELVNKGMDVPDILLVIQWRATCKLSTLWQRWGRAARDKQLQGTAILFAEKEHFDDVQEERRQHQEMKKRKDRPSAINSLVSKCQCGVGMVAPTEHEEDHELEGGLDENECDNGGNVINGDSMGLGDKELQETLKSTMDGKTGSNAWKKSRELDPAMDRLINAHLRNTILCRRRVFRVHFDNASAVPYRSRLTKHEMGPKEHELCDSLEDWQEAATERIYGGSNLNDYGPSLVMPDSVLDCIVDCAHYKKIVTIDDLRKETQWSGVDQFGGDVIAVIHCIIPVPIPVPVFTSNPLQPLPRQSVNITSLNTQAAAHPLAPTVTNQKQSRCSACNLEGHNKQN
ncbi:hypothetical protein BDR05DRAFT_947343 [Suillus weaverae]|nr:hypothetical protein BDR05DRAFT_947343 [Suillus weaverae]